MIIINILSLYIYIYIIENLEERLESTILHNKWIGRKDYESYVYSLNNNSNDS